MKKILLIIVLFLLVFVASCETNKNGENEKEMEKLELSIEGKLENNQFVLNPLFTWKNIGLDDYTIELSLNGEVIESKRTNITSFQPSELLERGKEYKLTISEAKTGSKDSVVFTTSNVEYQNVDSIVLDNPFMSGMVIQRDTDTVISGVGPKMQIISLSINNESYHTISNESGRFEITLPKRGASFNPQTITITNGANATAEISDVLFGDVYLFAGQSNMQWQTASSDYTDRDIQNLVNSNVRFFSQDVVTSPVKKDYVTNGKWFKPNEINCLYFSAISAISASLLSVSIKKETPIGIVTAYQGDTNIANWMGPEYYTGTCSTKFIHYNAMVYPLRHTKLSGVVWYQGCNNSAAGCDYKEYLLEFFTNYRELFNSPNLPFFVIGLACYDGDNGNNFDFSYVRESQALACEMDENAYFISTCDDGDPTYIHPYKKHYICERVAKSIQAVNYGKSFLSEGPSYKSHKVIGNKVYVTLNNSEGLYATSKINNFYIAGSDGKYHEANVSIQNEQLVAYSNKVDNPVYIKYGFGKSPFVNVFNKDDYSLVPFRTDDYGTNIDLFDYDSADKYYFHPEGSAMNVELHNRNLKITKAGDGRTYGSVRLDKWGAVIYQPQGFEFSIVGTNSKASIAIRFIEGDSSEIWGYKITDDFVGERTFNISVSDFYVMYNKQNNKFEPTKISYIEVMVEKSGEATFEISEARFITLDRSAPKNFVISSVSEIENNISVTLSNSLFAVDYTVSIKGKNSEEWLCEDTKVDKQFSFDKSLFELGVPYYVYAKAINELGENDASNNGFVFYLKNNNEVIICNFDFLSQDALQSYIDSSMSVHNGLTCELQSDGVKIISSGAGWQQFIFKLETGISAGMSKLVFNADFSNYNGEIVMQLADTSWNTYNYTINLNEQNSGTFEIAFNSFKKGDTPFTTQNLMWVMFNFNDNTGNGYILLDDVKLTK